MEACRETCWRSVAAWGLENKSNGISGNDYFVFIFFFSHRSKYK